MSRVSPFKTRKVSPEAGQQPHTQQAPCTIQFGHNVADRKVCMIMSVPATQMIFSPEEAEDVARKLQHYAQAARGEKPA
jgi:hypothetical protein